VKTGLDLTIGQDTVETVGIEETGHETVETEVIAATGQETEGTVETTGTEETAKTDQSQGTVPDRGTTRARTQAEVSQDHLLGKRFANSARTRDMSGADASNWRTR
jgi:hypothetical protein